MNKRLDALIKDAGIRPGEKRGADMRRQLEERRNKVLARIARAAERHLDINNEDHEDIVYQRVWDAQRCRISKAESLADLAETGDFLSPITWLQVEQQGVVLWKGYVLAQGELRLRYVIGPDGADGAGMPGEMIDTVDIVCVQIASPRPDLPHTHLAYVLGRHVSCNYVRVVAWTDVAYRSAMIGAYVAYCIAHKGLRAFTADEVPREFLDKLDMRLDAMK